MPMKRCPKGHYYDSSKNTTCPYCGVQKISNDSMETQGKYNTPNSQGNSAMKRCPNGHYYDTTKFSSCPSCWGKGEEVNVTQAKRVEKPAEKPIEKPVQKVEPQEGVTVGIIKKNIGIDPVVGWLVCIDGKDKGRDYRIRSERNFIGRSDKMDICIVGDETISRENHAVISYSPKKNTFKVHPGEGRGIVYLNGEEVDIATDLKPYDLIEMGESQFLFIPFCGEYFVWEQKVE